MTRGLRVIVIAAQRAFEADPSPQSARAFLTALARERGAPIARVLALVDAPERGFAELCWACEALPEDGQRGAVWEAVSALIAGWSEFERVYSLRHALAELRGADPPRPLLRRLDAARFGAESELDLEPALRANPRLRELRLERACEVDALPPGLRALSAPGEMASALAAHSPPAGLEDVSLRGRLDGPFAPPWSSRVRRLRLPWSPPDALGGADWSGLRELSGSLPLLDAGDLWERAPGLERLRLRGRCDRFETRLLLQRELASLRLDLRQSWLRLPAEVAARVTELGLTASGRPLGIGRFSRLRELDIELSEDGAALTPLLTELAESGGRERLERLSLRGGDGASPLAALTELGGWGLRALHWGGPLRDEALPGLRAALPELTNLGVDAALSPAGLRALGDWEGLRATLAYDPDDLRPLADALREAPREELNIVSAARWEEAWAILSSPVGQAVIILSIVSWPEPAEPAMRRLMGLRLPRLLALRAPEATGLRRIIPELVANPRWPRFEGLHLAP